MLPYSYLLMCRFKFYLQLVIVGIAEGAIFDTEGATIIGGKWVGAFGMIDECRVAICEGFCFHEDRINPDAPSGATAGCGIGDNFITLRISYTGNA